MNRRFDWKQIIVPLALLSVLAVLAMFTGQWPWNGNLYNSYTLEACAWLEGRLDLGQDYPWLELAVRDGRYYVSFPPFPAMLLLPFAAIWGKETPDGWIALVTALLGAIYALRICRRCRRSDRDALLLPLYLLLGNGYLFLTLNGYVWFFAQNLCFTLSLMAICYAAEGKGVRSLGCWAAAVGCRPMIGLFLPVLLWLLYRAERTQDPDAAPLHLILRRWYWILLPAIIGGTYMVLNLLRFGDPLEFGHNYLPEFIRAEEGQFSLSYIGANAAELLRLPQPQEGGALGFHTLGGQFFLLTAPMLLTAFLAWIIALRRKPLRCRCGSLLWLMPVLCLLYVLILCAHRTLGAWQFGNRYLVDILPWVFLALVMEAPEDGPFVPLNVPLMFFGTAINLIGTALTYNFWI